MDICNNVSVSGEFQQEFSTIDDLFPAHNTVSPYTYTYTYINTHACIYFASTLCKKVCRVYIFMHSIW